MSPFAVILLIWLGLAVLVIAAGLWIAARQGPQRGSETRIVEPEGARPDDALEQRKAA